MYDHVETVPRREPTHCFEAFTMLAALSQVTERAELGQMVTCASYRNVGLLAKEAAGVDVFSGGRLILGIGAGWYEREYQAYDYEFMSGRERLRVLDEALQVIPRLWSDETVDFDGTYVHFEGAFCDPKPLRSPRPPIWVGGGGEQVTLRIAARARRRDELAGGVGRVRAQVRRAREALRRGRTRLRVDRADPRTGLPPVRLRGGPGQLARPARRRVAVGPG